MIDSRGARAGLVLVLLMGLDRPVQAASDFAVRLEPVIAWETTPAEFAPPRTLYRLLYGGRAVGSYKRVAIEGAYTRGSLRDEVAAQAYSLVQTTEAFSGGFRYLHPVFSFLSAQARVGWEIRRTEETQTLGGIALQAQTPWQGRPYAGIGATLEPFRGVALGAQLSAFFEDPQNLLRRVTPQLSFALSLSPL
jgi:hypothetical protein